MAAQIQQELESFAGEYDGAAAAHVTEGNPAQLEKPGSASFPVKKPTTLILDLSIVYVLSSVLMVLQ